MNVTEARRQVRQFESDLTTLRPTILEVTRSFSIFVALRRELGVSGDIWELLTVLQQIQLAAEMATRGVYLLYTAAGPVGWALGLGTIALGAFSMMSIRRPRY